MTATTAPALTTRTRARTSPALHVARRQGVAALRLAAWFWPIALLALAAATATAWVVAGRVDVSIAVHGRQALVWFLFSQAIQVAATYPRVHVAAGMTRRSLVRGTLLASGATGVAYALVLTGVVLLERWLHGLAGWGSVLREIQLAGADAPPWALPVDTVVLTLLAITTGLLVGITYQRWGAWATLTLPLTVGPLLALLYLGIAPTGDVPGLGQIAPRALVGLVGVVGVVVVLAVAAAFAVIARRLPLSAQA
ncbi:MAG: hypothetical protein J7503_05040 [Cellulomonas iranensis]|uniref:hypothetical protein n=1 Tax=Cellulomonas iranensis TaxID=76862 RepID=UPI001B2BFF93|nr:hypothetical protein [Cellulomonas iranensis]MBO9568172.1 hypothetical protein [Cellulomonas iranensis]